MRENKGFSFIELLVVVTILATAITLLSASISTIFSLNAKKCANEIDSMVSKCKVGAMSRAGNVYLVIYEDSSGLIAQYYDGSLNPDGTAAPPEISEIGKARLDLYYTDSNGNTYTDPLCISFNRSTGGLVDIVTAAGLAGVTPGTLNAGVFCESITVNSGGKSYIIHLVPSTGKHYITSLGASA